MSKVDRVTARFGGVERVFHYPRVPAGTHNPFTVDGFSPYAAFNRFGAGNWTMEDLLRALCPRKDQFTAWKPDPEVVAVLEANGPGNYAVLAARVLEASLFGVPAAAAKWDERRPFDVPGQKRIAP